MQRGVLGVNRDQLGVGCLGQRAHQLAADDKALFVREGHIDAGAQRHDRRAKPRGANDRVQNEVSLRVSDECPQALVGGKHLTPPLRRSAFRGPGVRQGHSRNAVVARLCE